MRTNKIIYTFHVFIPPSSTKTPVKASQIRPHDLNKLKRVMNRAEAIIPTPNDTSTRFVSNTIIIANTGGTIDHIVLSIHTLLSYIRLLSLYATITFYR